MPREKAPKAEIPPDLQLTNKLISAHRQLFVDQMREEGGSQVKFTQLSIVALLQVAAILAVDVGVNHDQFTALCNGNYKEAFKRAPKFG